IVQVLETVDFNGAAAKMPRKYSTQFKNIASGEYRLILQYGGSGETARIAVDELKISAPFKYDGGCSVAPVVLKSKVTGRPDRTAFGSLLLNDKDQNDQKLTAYLIKGSAHGHVQLNQDGTFVFTPYEGFEGTSTSFVYKVCEEGAGSLCSSNTTVRIDFPNASTSLVDFKGAYKFNGNVELIWNTSINNTIEKFSLERSFDGHKWEYAGTVSNDPNANIYAYIDNVGKGVALKRDIYYRLKQTNTDGNILVSKLLIVRVYNTKTLTMISVTPSPAVNDITANVQLQENSYVTMRVLNKDGVAVLRKVVEGVPGLNTFSVEGSSKLEPGAYILELVVNSNERMLVKLVKE
ncbi:MAG: cadherin-like domain-containing protein, partial [Chitinophagaceae bacterium]|nr:cadherin-like domain-containing protein [Chitinophagaceae bacterium]